MYGSSQPYILYTVNDRIPRVGQNRIYAPYMTVYLYIWWFSCQKHRIYTVYIWSWPTLRIPHNAPANNDGIRYTVYICIYCGSANPYILTVCTHNFSREVFWLSQHILSICIQEKGKEHAGSRTHAPCVFVCIYIVVLANLDINYVHTGKRQKARRQ